MQERRGWAFGFCALILKPLLLLLTKRDWVNGERLPARGGFVIVINHLSHLDPLTAAHLVFDHGRIPRYLAKAALFKVTFLGPIMRGAGQIPVERHSAAAGGAYSAAVEAVRDGKCVVVYPEGTITRDPDGWPMVGKSGAARIALATGCPVIPVGQWGAQEILPAYSSTPHFFPRKTIRMYVGEPVDLADLMSDPGRDEFEQATERIMDAITGLVAEIRGEEPPAQRYDMRVQGDPYKKKRDDQREAG
ncbi:MAG: 1-acyl-sn-glycerol-3-phosphate acyltransferase [Nocardioides sp.]|nr:1-acyl-sn-glycerol-3-phosphate acyltransferase [Nocardioides sp.]